MFSMAMRVGMEAYSSHSHELYEHCIFKANLQIFHFYRMKIKTRYIDWEWNDGTARCMDANGLVSMSLTHVDYSLIIQLPLLFTYTHTHTPQSIQILLNIAIQTKREMQL